MSATSGANKHHSRTSEEMKGLLDHQKQVKAWLAEVNAKIFSLEEQYLEETPLGNIIRGWEIDGKPLPLKTREVEKERLFSYSSYQVWFDRKIASENESYGEKRNRDSTSSANNGAPKPKKQKRSSSSSNTKIKDDLFTEDWDHLGDY
jgi:hypothetical protein